MPRNPLPLASLLPLPQTTPRHDQRLVARVAFPPLLQWRRLLSGRLHLATACEHGVLRAHVTVVPVPMCVPQHPCPLCCCTALRRYRPMIDGGSAGGEGAGRDGVKGEGSPAGGVAFSFESMQACGGLRH